MNIVLFDEPKIKTSLLPFTFTRPVAEIRVGIFTIADKWRRIANSQVSFLTDEYLSKKFASKNSGDNYIINGALLPDEKIFQAIAKLEKGEALVKEGLLLAVRADFLPFYEEIDSFFTEYSLEEYGGNIVCLKHHWDIFALNGAAIKADFATLDMQKSKEIIDPHTIIYNKENIYVEDGADVKAAILNAESGPIYIGKNAQIQEGAIVRGPFALCEGSVVNMGSKMRGDTTIGPYSKVGGEINNSVIFGYSNKSHDGFMGNSVLGEWCNLGADTNTSNLKNNYSNVKVWDYFTSNFIDSNRQFCGLMMGDHSKAGINTMFNTGTVVGVHANIFGGGFPPKFIPSYSWGGSDGFDKYDFDKALQVASKVMERRNVVLENEDYAIFKHIFAMAI